MKERVKPSGKALIPFLIFIGFYLVSGIILQRMGVEMAFYAIPSPISIIMGVIAAFLMFKGSLDDKMNSFIKGCGDENIVIMCIIYLLAGAFSVVASKMGGVESVVNLCLSIMPIQFVVAGIFLIAVFISTATGTSVGTVVALGTICVGICDKSGISLPIMLGALVGGSLAGDNLSVISDTTIAATRSLNVPNKDKFVINAKFMVPAVIVTTIILLIVGRPENAIDLGVLEYNVIKIIPYLFVLVTALMGLNVFVVLLSGIVMAGIIGMAFGSFGFIEFTQHIYSGFVGILDVFILSLFTGGLAHMVREEGGIEWVIEKVKRNIKGPKSAELAFSGLTAITDAAVANNTVSILITGQVAREMAKENKVDPRRLAALIDTFACVMQGIIPYGAQLLIVSGYTAGRVSPVELVPYVWYLYLLAFFALLSIYVRFADMKTGWDFEKEMPIENAPVG